MSKNSSQLDKAFLYGGPIFLLIIMNGLNLYLLNFLAPQVTYFLMEVSPVRLSPEEAYDHFYKYAIACEACIFVLTAIGETRAAKWFIVVSVATQFLYMHRWDDILLTSIWEDPQQLSKGVRLLAGSMIFSTMAQIAMWFLAEQIKRNLDILRDIFALTPEERRIKRQHQQMMKAEIELKRATGKRWYSWINKAANTKKMGTEPTEPTLADQLNGDPKIFKHPHHANTKEGGGFTCGICSATFENIAGLNGHQRIHRESDRKAADEQRELIIY
jgi:hypothetical protein